MLAKLMYFWYLALLLGQVRGSEPVQASVYNVWTGPGLHLVMSDNGTPGNYDDDFVVDWEDNRQVKVTILDN